MIDWKEVKELIGSFGFPIFIAIWLLWERRNIGNILVNRMDHLIALLEMSNLLNSNRDTREAREEKEREVRKARFRDQGGDRE